MGHVVLLGDSIFDNGAYVDGGPAVVDHLRKLLPRDWKATLLALDGALAEQVHKQLRSLPADATHLILSAGGNNALGCCGLVRAAPSDSYAHTLSGLRTIQLQFAQEYRRMLEAATALGLPTTVCTIYDSVPILEPAELAGLSLFNDVILREAFRLRATVVDLRLVCTRPEHYAAVSPIEPSVEGGFLIAEALHRMLFDHDSASLKSRVY